MIYSPGYMGVVLSENDWKVTPKGLEFISRLRQLPNTANPNTGYCSNRTDDEGKLSLFNVSTPTGYKCTGLVYSSDINSDGSNLSQYSAYVYDAAKTIIDGIVSYITSITPSGQQLVIPPIIDGIALSNYMIGQNRLFSGYTGEQKHTNPVDITDWIIIRNAIIHLHMYHF